MALYFLLNFYGISSAPKSTGKGEWDRSAARRGQGWALPGSLVPRAGGATSPPRFPATHPLQGQLPGATAGARLPAPRGLPCARPAVNLASPPRGLIG